MLFNQYKKNLIWILEDDETTSYCYEKCLQKYGEIESFFEISTLAAKKNVPDLLIADLQIGRDNFLNYIKSNQINYPFMIISSNDTDSVLNECFQLGAQDYFVKPFNSSEMKIKIEKFFQINQKSNSLNLCTKEFTVSLNQKKTESLTIKEFQIISSILKNKNRSLSRHEITTSVWGTTKVGTKTLDVHMVHLRRKIAKIGITIHCDENSVFSITQKDEAIFSSKELYHNQVASP